MNFNFSLREAPLRLQLTCPGNLGDERETTVQVWLPTTCFYLLFTNTEHLQCPEVTLTRTWITGLSHTGDGASLF